MGFFNCPSVCLQALSPNKLTDITKMWQELASTIKAFKKVSFVCTDRTELLSFYYLTIKQHA
jgi:hypothetical protein